MTALLSKKVSIIYLILIVVVTSASTYLFAKRRSYDHFLKRQKKKHLHPLNVISG
ncbi:MAG: hypothetical protein IPH45_17330 [Bacteroidales bacterium]|nr:hypothetical protein [Bacteroidales bacterium]